jgi:predicted anti-sigma-YlaC factor YlaD
MFGATTDIGLCLPKNSAGEYLSSRCVLHKPLEIFDVLTMNALNSLASEDAQDPVQGPFECEHLLRRQVSARRRQGRQLAGDGYFNIRAIEMQN